MFANECVPHPHVGMTVASDPHRETCVSAFTVIDPREQIEQRLHVSRKVSQETPRHPIDVKNVVRSRVDITLQT